MEKAKIKQIGDYLKDLEEGLVELDYRGQCRPCGSARARAQVL
ncbi:MAG: hypothetical protein ACYTE3_19930 [Planctomycetota bacterium]|jgi:hypothetical protein